MNTVIAHSEKSNDSDAMSPALTQDSAKNVAIESSARSPLLVSKLKKLVPTSYISDPTLKTDKLGGQTEHAYNVNISLNGKEILHNEQTKTSPTENFLDKINSQIRLSNSPTLSESNEHIAMTPRILPSAVASDESQNTQLVEASCSKETGNSTSVAKQPRLLSVTDLCEENAKIEHRTMNVIKRIRRLQSILINQSTKYEFKKFVEEQCKQLSNRVGLNGESASSLSNSFSLSMLTNNSEKLGSLSTSTLVNIVQRMRSAHSLNASNSDTCSSSVSLAQQEKDDICKAVGVTCSTIKKLLANVDSDATESSSGGETDDEVVDNISNTSANVQSHSAYAECRSSQIRERSCWRWVRDRAMIVSRWTWLQAQVSDLEYKIRQHGEIHKQFRAEKVPVLPVSSPAAKTQSADDTEQAARCKPLTLITHRKKHKIVRVSNAPALSPKARRPINIPCRCVRASRQCAVCAGDHNYAKQIDIQLLPPQERIGQLDAGFHPVLSFPRDIDAGIDLEEVINSSDRRHATTARPAIDKQRLKLNKKHLAESLKKKKLAMKMKKALEKENARKRKSLNNSPEYIPGCNVKKQKLQKKLKSKKKYGRLRNKPILNVGGDDDDEVEFRHAEMALSQSAPASELSKTSSAVNKRSHSYDIDDIVIPYHIASTTRVEKLQYKEIDTPRWREFTVNGSTVHEQLRRRSSSVSLAVTPMTPAASDHSFPGVPPSHVSGDVASEETDRGQLVVDAVDSHQSFSPSLSSQEIENLSEHRYIARHSVLEAKEKARYMNFVTSGRRARTQSATLTAPAHKATPTPPEVLSPDISVDSFQQANVMSTNSLASSMPSSLPLSASHDSAQIKDELSVADRQRSSSFTAGNRTRRENAVPLFTTDHRSAAPWPKRTFPLNDKEVEGLSSKPRLPKKSWENFSAQQWKVINPEQTLEEKSSLVLKLSKT